MEFCIQDFVWYTTLIQHGAYQLRSIDIDGTNQNRLSFLVCFFYFIHNSMEFFLLGLINSILFIHTDNRSVGRNLDNVHSIDVTELFFLCQSGTGHTCFLIILIEEVLECNIGKGLALTFYFYMLFCFNCLM